MVRTTVDIDGRVFRELKALRRKERVSLGRIMSRLLAEALSRRKAAPSESARPMGEIVDLTDKEALDAALDRENP